MTSAKKSLLLISLATVPLTAHAQQSPPPAQEPMHHHMNIAAIKPVFPRFGHAQENAHEKLFTLDDAQHLAAECNPTLRQAEAEIRAAKARMQQAGLYPNPSLGYTGDEIRGGAENGGKQGFFVAQTIVTAGKLGKARGVFEQESRLAQFEAEEQKLRVQDAVKVAYYRVLAAQELLDTRKQLAQIDGNYAEVERQLSNTGQADETEVLEAEIDAQRMRLSARMQENTLCEQWKSLTAVLGRPELPLVTVSGDLQHDLPEINEEQAIDSIAAQSPAVRIADSAAARAAAETTRAKSQAIPDIQLKGGLEYNGGPLDLHVTGWEGLAEASVQIPIFNRNQGNVAAAAADLERAQFEKQRIALTLRERAATTVDEYANGKLMALEYRDEMLPRAQKAYALMSEKYGQMLASYPRVLQSQRKLFELHAEYIQALETVWTTGIALQGYLLTDGLESPARPTEVDHPVRETNVPMPERTMSPRP
jgi:outer membrane protein, heavy metal efflux system